MEKSISQLIIDFLSTKQDWVWGGVIEEFIRGERGSKGGTTSRILRTMSLPDGKNPSILVVRKVQVEGKGPHCVQYTIRPRIDISQLKPKKEEVYIDPRQIEMF